MDRVSLFATPLDIQFVHAARKPSNCTFSRAIENDGVTPENTIMVGDQMLTDVLWWQPTGIVYRAGAANLHWDEGLMTRFNRRRGANCANEVT